MDKLMMIHKARIAADAKAAEKGTWAFGLIPEEQKAQDDLKPYVDMHTDGLINTVELFERMFYYFSEKVE